MTPKQRANDIINKHYFILFDSESDKGEEVLVSSLATKAALITVDEIIKTCNISAEVCYWAKVRNEIVNY